MVPCAAGRGHATQILVKNFKKFENWPDPSLGMQNMYLCKNPLERGVAPALACEAGNKPATGRVSEHTAAPLLR